MALNHLGQKPAAFVVMLAVVLLAFIRPAAADTTLDDGAVVTVIITVPGSEDNGSYWLTIVNADGVEVDSGVPVDHHQGSYNDTVNIIKGKQGLAVGHYTVWLVQNWSWAGNPQRILQYFAFDVTAGSDSGSGGTGGNSGGGNGGNGGTGGDGGTGGNGGSGGDGGNGGNGGTGGDGGNGGNGGNSGGNNSGGDNSGGDQTVNMPGDLPGPGHMAPAPGVGGLDDIPDGTGPSSMGQGLSDSISRVMAGIPSFGSQDAGDWTFTMMWFNDEQKTFVLPWSSNANANLIRVTLRAMLALAITAYFFWRIINDIKAY